MPISILMPALSPTMTEGTLVAWHKAEGDTVRSGDILAEIETDKATMEVEAVDEGVLGAIVIAAGTANVKVNSTIGILLAEGESKDALAGMNLTTPPATAAPSPTAVPGAPQPTPETSAPRAEAAAALAPASDIPEPGRRSASPLAKRIAQEKGVSLRGLQGSGPQGRIIKRDVEGAACARPPSSAPAPVVPSAIHTSGPILPGFSGYEPPFTEAPLGSMRRVIAQRLVESKQQIPHFYLSVDVAIDTLLRARALLNKEGNLKISVNDMVMKATAMALAATPGVNSAWTGDHIRHYTQVDLSVAVSLDDGLITPVIRAAETKGLAALSAEMKDLAVRARAGKLKPHEFQGGTFSLSNLGMFGIQNFAAIVNPPQAAILAIGAGQPRAVVQEGVLAVATLMTLTLSMDHRVIDGALGARFLKTLKDFLEEPTRMLL